MATSYKAPGVYVEEKPAAAPIVGVGTSTPAFIGVWPDAQPDPDVGGTASAGAIVPCTNMTDFKTAFGNYTSDKNKNDSLSILGHAVQGFFENQGTFCYVVRAASE